jgi:hypothetical protein
MVYYRWSSIAWRMPKRYRRFFSHARERANADAAADLVREVELRRAASRRASAGALVIKGAHLV